MGGNVVRDIHLLVPTPRREGKVQALWKEGLQENQENVQAPWKENQENVQALWKEGLQENQENVQAL